MARKARANPGRSRKAPVRPAGAKKSIQRTLIPVVIPTEPPPAPTPRKPIAIEDCHNVEAAEAYARDVVADLTPASKWTRLACERHLEDRKREGSEKFGYRFDAPRAERVVRFVQLLPHTKGRWAKKNPADPSAHLFKLQPWELFIVAVLFGWLRKGTELRRFRKASIYLPRKNGKSMLGAAIGWWMLGKDDEIGAEVYSGATSEKQAWEVFKPARQMALTEPLLPEGLGVTVGAQRLYKLHDGSKFEPIIGKPGDGASPSCAIVDEYHEHPTSELYDTMLTGMGARQQPLLLVISTSGDNLAGPCYDDWLTVKKVLEKVTVDDTHFGIIFTIDDGDDWTSEMALRKANPNFGVSVDEEFLHAQLRDAINNARSQGTFKTKHLNIWVQARDAYINMQRWAQCAKTDLRLEQFEKRVVYIGLDLASKVDIAALEILIPLEESEGFVRFGKYYLPEATVDDPVNEHYRKWHKEGWLTVTAGNIIDFTRIQEDVMNLTGRFEVSNVGYDPHQATMLVTELQHAGVPCLEFRPTVLNFSEPMKQVEALIRERKLKHNGDPVMTWMMSNVVAKSDAKDNVYPRKERDQNKIDGFVALVMAMGLAQSDDGQYVSSRLVTM